MGQSAANSISVTFSGRSFVLRADGSLFWPDYQTLLVADLHLGKTEAFREHAVPLPGGSTETTLERLTTAVQETNATNLYVLGDMWHSAQGVNQASLAAFAAARDQLPENVTLIVGNHDRRVRRLGSELGYHEMVPPYRLGDVTLCHDPCEADTEFALAGHVHPVVRVQELRLSARLKCFAFVDGVLILPSFGDFTGGAPLEPQEAEKIYVLAGREVVPLKG